MSRRVYVVGVGLTKFVKPGSVPNWDYPQMAVDAGNAALKDAGLSFKQVEQAFVGYVYGTSTCGQRAVYGLGMTGIPIYNVHNNCATGATALYLAKQMIAGGLNECVLALGFEKMQRGSLNLDSNDRTNPLDRHISTMTANYPLTQGPLAPQMFGNAALEHMAKYGTTKKQFAKVAYKNHTHSVHNPYAQFQVKYSLDEILNSPLVHDPLTKLQCCPTSDGAGAAIVCSEDFVKKHNLQSRAIRIAGMSMATDFPNSFDEKSCVKMLGSDVTKAAAKKTFEEAGIGPQDAQVVELHDCFSANELLTYEALGLCETGKGGQLIEDDQVTYGGKWVVNPSGGLISKGHPLGATGLAQCAELVWQLRGTAGKRQVNNVKACIQHNLGLGSAAVVSVYTK